MQGQARSSFLRVSQPVTFTVNAKGWLSIRWNYKLPGGSAELPFAVLLPAKETRTLRSFLLTKNRGIPKSTDQVSD